VQNALRLMSFHQVHQVLGFTSAASAAAAVATATAATAVAAATAAAGSTLQSRKRPHEPDTGL